MKFIIEDGAPDDSGRALVAWLTSKETLSADERHALTIGGGLEPVLSRLIDGGDFEGGANEVATLYPTEAGPRRVLLVGLGKRANVKLETIRRAAGAAARRARALRAGSITFVVREELLEATGASARDVGRALLDAAALAAFRDLRYGPKARKKNDERAGAATLETIGLLGSGDGVDAAGLATACREAGAVLAGATPARLLGN
ncbi:MAG: M17 family peptidase N-terminal domain-containing protein, partial [Planctomycetota bacterium]